MKDLKKFNLITFLLFLAIIGIGIYLLVQYQ